MKLEYLLVDGHFHSTNYFFRHHSAAYDASPSPLARSHSQMRGGFSCIFFTQVGRRVTKIGSRALCKFFSLFSFLINFITWIDGWGLETVGAFFSFLRFFFFDQFFLDTNN